MNPPPYVGEGDDLTVGLWNRLVDFAKETLHPKVAAPLAVLDGVIYLADELKFFNCYTTSEIQPRSGPQMGKGTVDLYLPDTSGKLKVIDGIAARTVFSDNGNKIPKGIWSKVYFKNGIWQMFNGDCSGVA